MAILSKLTGTHIRDTLAGGVGVADLNDTTNFNITTALRTIAVLPDTSPTITVLDCVEYSANAAHIGDYGYADLQTNNLPLNAGQATITSLTPSIATCTNSGVVSPLTSGVARFRVDVPNQLSRIVEITVVDLNGLPVTQFIHFVNGSLGEHIADAVTAKIGSLTSPITGARRPSSWEPLINIFQVNGQTRNTNGWWGNVDLTAIPAFIGEGSINGVLVTPRDLVIAAHYPGASGFMSYFVDNASVRYDRTVMNIRPIPSTDIAVVTLDADLPGNIKPISIMPADFEHYEPSPNQFQRIGYPVVTGNQDRTLLLMDYVHISSSGSRLIVFVEPTNLARSQWFYSARRGDSGSPIMHLIDGELALLSHFTWTNSGPCYADNIAAINTAIAANGSPHTVTVKSLGSFTRY